MCSNCSVGGVDTDTPRVSMPRDLTGRQSGRLSVLGKASGNGLWKCRCSCGNEKVIARSSLVAGVTKSCGCLKRDKQRERQEAMCARVLGQRFGDLVAQEYVGHSSFKCRCVCGTEIVIRGAALEAGNNKSCGCMRKRAKKSLIGCRFERLTVVAYAGIRSQRSSWHCKCDCGNEVEVLEHNLKAGRTLSCGCYRREHPPKSKGGPKLNLAGMRFGNLTVLERAEHLPSYWRCRCDCGNEIAAPSPRLQSGQKSHCGCLAKSRTELLGRRFGKLRVRAFAGNDPSGYRWACECDCGQSCEVRGSLLRSGRKTSCGCESGDSSAPFGKLKQVQRSKVPAWAERLAA